MTLELTDANFKAAVLDGNRIALIDFGAERCGPCKALDPIVEDIAREYEGKVLVGKVDADNNLDTSVKYGIRNLPTLVVIKNGQVVDKLVGTQPKANIVAMLQRHLS